MCTADSRSRAHGQESTKNALLHIGKKWRRDFRKVLSPFCSSLPISFTSISIQFLSTMAATGAMLRVMRRCSTKVPHSLSFARSQSLVALRNPPFAGQICGRPLAESIRLFQSSAMARNQAAESYAASSNQQPVAESSEDASKHSPATTFAQLRDRNMVDQTVINNLTNSMRLTTMTAVQQATINKALEGVDLYVWVGNSCCVKTC